MEPLPLIPLMSAYVLKHLSLITNSDQEVQAFSDKLLNLQQALRDAQRLHLTNPGVNGWIKDVEGAMFQMEDVVDELASQILQLQIDDSLSDSDPRQELDPQLTLDAINDLSAQLDTVIAKKDDFNFTPNHFDQSQQEETTSIVNESRMIFGRDANMERLVTRLVSDANGAGVEMGARIISIAGVGGVGKTTLAQRAFNHPKVVDHFGALRAWVSLPNMPIFGDSSELTRSIIKELEDLSLDGLTGIIGMHDNHLNSILSEKPFLLVLDNLLTENASMFNSLPYSLRKNPGVKCLVITQSEEIATKMARNEELELLEIERLVSLFHDESQGGDLVTTRSKVIASDEEGERLSLLSNSDCGKILNQIALATKMEEAKKEFQDIGLKIASKCNGLPLAAEAIGIMLATKSTTAEWDNVLNSPLWEYTHDEKNDAFLSLNVCFVNLPLELRGCFLSCATFSKGQNIEVDELIKIWMAWGYLDSTQSFDEVRLKGLGYVRRLVARSFFHEFNEVSMFVKVHNLMHDFATYLFNSKNGFIYDGWPKKQFNFLSERVPLNSIGTMGFFIARNALQEELPPSDILIGQLKRVRQLVLSNCNLNEIPPEIGKLIHLRYLDVSQNPIWEFPETAYNLCYLETLNIDGTWISKLPDGIERLQRLRHIVMDETYMLTYPQGFEKLTNLWTINCFTATRYTESFLGSLNQIRGCLKIKFDQLYMDTDAEETMKSNLSDKHEIEELDLLYVYADMDVLEATIPPSQIRTLSIRGWGSIVLPSWITSVAILNNLKELTIDHFEEVTDLPPLGKLPLLEKLTVDVMRFTTLTTAFLGISDGDGSGGFPRLKELRFSSCFLWNEWEDVEEDEGSVVIPCLETLIVWASELVSLPRNLLNRGKALRIVVCPRALGERSDISQTNAVFRWIGD